MCNNNTRKPTGLTKLAGVALSAAVNAGVATMIGAGALFPTPTFAADFQPAPKSIDQILEVIGRGLASKADEQLKAEVGKYARENIFFGITGDLKPNGEVSYAGGGLTTRDGRVGVVLRFNVHARAKIDAGTGPFTTKVWALDTVQVVDVVVLPKKREDGSVVAEVSAEIVSATATKERKAHQREADSFRDRVSTAIKEKLQRFTGEHNLNGILNGIPH